jgi:hypothetical protein
VRAPRRALVVLAAFVACAAPAAPGAAGGADWPTFGFDAARQGVGPATTGITAANVGSLRRQLVRLEAPSTGADLPPTQGRREGRDVFFVTMSYGKTGRSRRRGRSAGAHRRHALFAARRRSRR